MHGKDEFLLAIQVLAPRFRFFGTFILENENAGGSTFSIHRDILLEEAIVTHLVTGHGRDHGRDHLVHIQSRRHNLVVVNVQLRRDKIHLRPIWTSCKKTHLTIIGISMRTEVSHIRGQVSQNLLC